MTKRKILDTGSGTPGKTKTAPGTKSPSLPGSLVSFIEMLEDPVFVIAIDGTIIAANRVAGFFIGISDTQMIESKIHEFFVEEEDDDRLENIENFTTLLREGRLKNYEMILKTRNDERLPLSITATAIEGEPPSGRRCFALIGRDVISQRMSELGQRRLATAINAVVDAIFITNLEGLVEYVNPAFETVTGYSRDEIIGANPRILKSEKNNPLHLHDMWATLQSGNTWRGTMKNRRKDGTEFVADETIAPIKDQLGVITDFVAVIRDMTEHNRLEEQLRQTQKMDAIGRLAGGIAHDFNNLLSVINGYSELILEQCDHDDSRHELANQILIAGERAAALTRQLLAVSRKQVLKLRVLNINDIIINMEKMIKRLIGEHIEIRLELEERIGLIKIDPGQFEQVLLNLVINARDAMPEGGTIKIMTKNVAASARIPDRNEIPQVALIVSDDGTGIDEQIREKIFDPFFTTKEKDKGTGMGLSIVLSIVSGADGKISVDTCPGKGSTFTIHFPAVESENDDLQKISETTEETKGVETILLVEDEEVVRDFITEILKRKGYRVFVADNGQSGLEQFEKHQDEIDLVVTDVVMPKMNGLQLVNAIKKRKPTTRIILISGYTDDTHGSPDLLNNNFVSMQKPFKNKEFLALVREVLRK